MMKLLGSLIIALGFTCALFGQSKEQLEQERLKIIKDIEATSNFLQSTKKDKETTSKAVKTLEIQVDNRKKLISNIRTEIVTSDNTLKFF